MRKRTRKYSLRPSYAITKEGVSIFTVQRDEESLSFELLEKYSKDMRELLCAKLDRLSAEYKVPAKEIERIKNLIAEIESLANAER